MYSNNSGGYNRPSYSGYGGYGQSGSNGYSGRGSYGGSSRPQKKRSGAKFIRLEDGKMCVSAWRVSKGQLLVLYARPYSKTDTVESQSGKHWQNLFCTITNRTTLQVTKCSGLLDVDGCRLYIKELNLIATKGGQGGYFGRQFGGSKK
jgi:hypothetical protein